MRLLLDTHIFLWLNGQPERLTPGAMRACADPDNQLLLSIASLWEIQIKHQLGKLSLAGPWPEMVRTQEDANDLRTLPITASHIQRLAALPFHHRDPFDRMLVAQAQIEGMTLITADAALAPYDIAVLW